MGDKKTTAKKVENEKRKLALYWLVGWLVAELAKC